ncbi:GMP reductase [Apilactobacillus xinyiensis]|uniref:GMP reductase n=1 Tax=Apilactobacillus xinyiensis TaxID=2841032 RepID=A0ABT0I2G9_9LACO|nr:GMP reductase [Apilactobacillus xinyiensis]MCK8624907.1 GMP reductase [Apilactobacillus xinyiensis]MCL0319024.1 GMP reductase [Apilactobacillus xinyiensis]
MKVFDYDDVQLIPAKAIMKSRSEADPSIKFGPRTFKLPVVPANMQTVIDENLATWLASNGYFYVMHRFQPEKRAEFIQSMHDKGLFASISVGIKDNEYDFITDLAKNNNVPEYITIDVAHGHSDYVIKMIHFIKENLPDSFLIVGNLGTPDAVREIENAGADATKIGIGPGKACITRYKTGFGTGGWQLSALKWCMKAATKPMIADGGIRTNGDIAKSIRFGASMVMIGSMFAGHEESPGEIVEKDGKKFKQYWGSASAKQKGEHRNVEGRQLLIPYRGSVNDTLNEMREDLQSSISYAGGTKLDAIRTVNYVIMH